MKTFLHVGCGLKRKEDTTPGFNTPDWSEIRLDIDPSTKPDIVASLTHMPSIEDGSIQGVFSSHNLEHLYPHEVPLALAEFHRVLSNDGFVIATCPDLKLVAKLITEDKLMDTLYVSSLGNITPLDILYGHRASVRGGNEFMAHRCGFTLESLLGALRFAGFGKAAGIERPKHYEIWALATKSKIPAEPFARLAKKHVPPSYS